MNRLSGNSINNGLFIGRAIHVATQEHSIERCNISPEEVKGEIKRFQDAIASVDAEIGNELKNSRLNPRELDIIASHRDILHDPEIYSLVSTAIEEQLHHAILAVQDSFNTIVEQFQAMSVEAFALRAADYRDVGTRLLNTLGGLSSALPDNLESDHIPIFAEMNPSMIGKLAHANIRAYLIAKGSYNSHASILARALGLIAIANVKDLLETVQDNDMLVVDGDEGKLIVNPDEETLDYYAQKVQVEEILRQRLEAMKASASQTADGKRISLYANIALPEELDAIVNLSCDGIGLFRTEFIFLARQSLPSEAEQYEIYRQIAERMAPTPVTIRTFDLGGDKLAPLGFIAAEENPYLGKRGIRFSLAHHDVFHTQLRAILRASAHGKIRIMFPMIIDVEDFSEAKHIFNHCQEELYSEGISFDSSIELGAMIEIPAAALEADALAQACDFLSIGTNDLVQYTLAVDRNNENVSRYYIQHHPAVLNLIRQTVLSAAKYKTPLSVCGEMASTPQYIPLLLGLGLRELSVNPGSYFTVKAIVQNCDNKLFQLISRFNFSCSVRDIEHFIYKDLKHYYQL
ncbi:MAG: phosphoenolpyruvate--protein phosphotransferase [Candidatus Cloacimonetes bacterium HGW-Cloacimonetes-3]|jgi:phosphotransferase system enzyme I (PtsI)|nr:MAG: phosphoenolpyruvate--protein phosphotransferase [Candidatus Cloacimonetes bacterium HGW-Cloacimonetes-3]